jgi:hypothetical protein
VQDDDESRSVASSRMSKKYESSAGSNIMSSVTPSIDMSFLPSRIASSSAPTVGYSALGGLGVANSFARSSFFT